MNPKRRNPIWYIACPIIINYAVGFCVQMAAYFIYIMLDVQRMLTVINDTEAYIEWINTIAGEILQYTTEITGMASLAMLPVALWLFHKDRKEEMVMGKTRPQKLSPDKYSILAVLGIVVCIAANNLITLSSVSSLSASYETTAQYLYSSSFPMQILCLGIIIPITEELVMRGLVYKRMCSMMTPKRAMVLSALIFGIMHGNIVQFIYATGLGMLLAYIYECYGSVKAPAFIHIVLNLTSVIASQFGLFTWIFYSPVRMAAVTIVCAAVGAAAFVMVQRLKGQNASSADAAA